MKRRYYFIDTENVGDSWLNLPKKIGKKDRIITFYTEFHSKQLEKSLLKQVHNPKILWIECMKGNNALDYQLIGALSYLIAKHPDAVFCICSNDKDYLSTVEFWNSRGVSVCQIGAGAVGNVGKWDKGQEESKGGKGKKKGSKEGKGKKKDSKEGKKAKKSGKKSKESKKAMEPNPVQEGMPAKEGEITKIEMLRQGCLKEEPYLMEFAKSIPVTDLESWYRTLTIVMGQEKGRACYLKIRDDEALRASLAKQCLNDKNLRKSSFVEAVLDINGLDVSKAKMANGIIQSYSRKNLNAMKAEFDRKFGKKPPQKYYQALRPHIRLLKG